MKHHMEHEHSGMHHSKHSMHKGREHMGMSEKSGRGMYRNEMEHPHVPMQGMPERGHGAEDFKGMAMDIAYGQAGKAGCMADEKRMRAQHKDYHWADVGNQEDAGSY
jgi:hypothetical protein